MATYIVDVPANDHGDDDHGAECIKGFLTHFIDNDRVANGTRVTKIGDGTEIVRTSTDLVERLVADDSEPVVLLSVLRFEDRTSELLFKRPKGTRVDVIYRGQRVVVLDARTVRVAVAKAADEFTTRWEHGPPLDVRDGNGRHVDPCANPDTLLQPLYVNPPVGYGG